MEPWLQKVWFPQSPFSLWDKCIIGLLGFKRFAAYSYLFLKQNGQGLNKTHIQKREWEIFQTLKTFCSWDLISSSWLRLRGLGEFRIWKFKPEGRNCPTFLSPVPPSLSQNLGFCHLEQCSLKEGTIGIMWPGLRQTHMLSRSSQTCPDVGPRDLCGFQACKFERHCLRELISVSWVLAELLSAKSLLLIHVDNWLAVYQVTVIRYERTTENCRHVLLSHK